MTAYDEHNEPDFKSTIARWQAHYEELSGSLNGLDQATEKVFLKMGKGVEDLSRRCRDILEMTRLATTTLSRNETLQAAQHLSHEIFPSEGGGIMHGILKDADSGENPDILPDILPNNHETQAEDQFLELWHLVRKLDEKTSPMAKRAMSISNALSDSINQIVIAVQFQDITRQEMDKVRESLESLAQRTNRGTNGKDDTTRETSDLLIDVIQTCDHQARRMEVVRKKITDAFSNIHKNLTGSGGEVMDICIIMASLAEIVQSIPFEIKKLVKQHKSAAPENGQEPDADRREFAILSKAVMSGTVRVLSLSRIVEEKARSLAEEIKEMERVLTDDHQISGTLERMVGDLREMAASSRAAALRLMPEGQEVPAIGASGDEPGLSGEEALMEEGHDDGHGSVEFF